MSHLKSPPLLRLNLAVTKGSHLSILWFISHFWQFLLLSFILLLGKVEFLGPICILAGFCKWECPLFSLLSVAAFLLSEPIEMLRLASQAYSASRSSEKHSLIPNLDHNHACLWLFSWWHKLGLKLCWIQQISFSWQKRWPPFAQNLQVLSHRPSPHSHIPCNSSYHSAWNLVPLKWSLCFPSHTATLRGIPWHSLHRFSCKYLFQFLCVLTWQYCRH